jgi:hypothetical protein
MIPVKNTYYGKIVLRPEITVRADGVGRAMVNPLI